MSSPPFYLDFRRRFHFKKSEQWIQADSGDGNPYETFAQLHKTSNYVIPAKAGIQYYQELYRFRFSPE